MLWKLLVVAALLCIPYPSVAFSTLPAVTVLSGRAPILHSRPFLMPLVRMSESSDAMSNGENSRNVFNIMKTLGPAGSANIWNEDGNQEIEPLSSEPISVPINGESVPVARIRPKMGMIFTCNVCETRQTQQFSKLAYEKGVVIVKCKGCDKRHLIADNLDWYKDWLGTGNKNIEQCLQSRGDEVKWVAGKTAASLWQEWYEPSGRIELR